MGTITTYYKLLEAAVTLHCWLRSSCRFTIGDNIKLLIDREDGTYCFRLHRDRVYYVSEKIMKQASNVARENLISLGTCFGKFTKTRKFRLHITALDFLAPYAQHKIWAKQDRGGAAVPVRSPRHEVRAGEDHREHAQIPGTDYWTTYRDQKSLFA